MACPLAYPGFSLLLWRFLFWSGLAILIFGAIYNISVKKHLIREVKLIPLTMIIGGILLIVGGIIYHLHVVEPVHQLQEIQASTEQKLFVDNLIKEYIKTNPETKNNHQLMQVWINTKLKEQGKDYRIDFSAPSPPAQTKQTKGVVIKRSGRLRFINPQLHGYEVGMDIENSEDIEVKNPIIKGPNK